MKQQLVELFASCVENSQLMRDSVAKDAGVGVSPAERAVTRRWTVSAASELARVSRAAIDQAENDGRLPPPERNEKGAKIGYTLHQIDAIRQVFGTAPWQPRAVTVAIPSNKGGSYKSTVTVHLAQWLSLQGYRVLVVDTDPQGTAGEYFGWSTRWVDSERTIAPWMFGKAQSLDYAIHRTCWPQLDIIPANQTLQRIDREMADMELPYPPHLMLRAGIETIANRYDVILIDGAPNLADGTIAQVFAADVLLCTTPAELHDTASTEQFFNLLKEITMVIPEQDVWAVPDVRILITKLSKAPGSSSPAIANKIRLAWGGLVMANAVYVTEEVGKAQLRMKTVFEQSRAERSSHSAWKAAIDMWESLFTEVLDTLVKPRWEA
ncbi:AAA family ATPase [Aeromonas veronii]